MTVLILIDQMSKNRFWQFQKKIFRSTMLRGAVERLVGTSAPVGQTLPNSGTEFCFENRPVVSRTTGLMGGRTHV
jgi:hypothetical protein